LADEGVYLGSESSFYRILKANNQLSHRGKAKPKGTLAKPDGFTAKNIHYHVQIKEPTNNCRGAVRYIPGPHFTGSRSRKSIRFCQCTFGFCFASVAKLIIGFQYTVKAGFRTQINSLIGQHGHNLTGR